MQKIIENIKKNNINHENDPLMSVVTVVFNGENLIENTIKSVLLQSYNNVEFLIIDGSSTDGTRNIIHAYEYGIDYYLSEKDQGIYDAMNKGIRAAKGDYLIFLNAGDVFSSENVLESVAKEVVSNEYPEILYGETNIFTDKGEFVKKLLPLRFSRLNLTLFGTRTVCHQSIFVRRQSAPFFDITYKLKGELCWYYDIIKQNQMLKAVSLPFPIANYLLGGVGDILFRKNILERMRVVVEKVGVPGCFIAVPSLFVAIIIRLKRMLISRVLRINSSKIQ